MSLKKPVPRILRFDERDPDKVSLYPFPYPNGERCIAITNGDTIHIYETSSGHTGSLLDGFAPHIEDDLKALHERICRDQYTKLRAEDPLPSHAYDIILFDKENGGQSTHTSKALDEWSFDPDWPVSPAVCCAQILTWMPTTSFTKGSDDQDIWQRRSTLKRALVNMGMANPYAHPAPNLRFMVIAPEHWDWPLRGCAAGDRKRFWRQVENCFKRGYRGCMVIDVWQSWSVNSDAFQLITEEDVI